MTPSSRVATAWHQLLAAAVLLTRLPLARLVPSDRWPDSAACVWAYPVVGAVVGLLAGLLHALLVLLRLPEPLPALWTVAGTLLLTGALHEDGLADAADALGARTLDDRLRVMRDSRIGPFGAAALLLALGVRVAAVAALHAPVAALLGLVAAAALARAAMLPVLLLLPPARPDGLAAALRPRGGVIAAGLALALVPLLALPTRTAVAALVAAGAASLLVVRLARRGLGGHTGDVLGAAAQLAECAALTALCSGLR